jgi:hypothetical protein
MLKILAFAKKLFLIKSKSDEKRRGIPMRMTNIVAGDQLDGFFTISFIG